MHWAYSVAESTVSHTLTRDEDRGEQKKQKNDRIQS